MKRNYFNLIGFLSLLILYNYFFWNEKLGINLPLFSLILATVIIHQNENSFKSRKVQVFLPLVLLTGFFVLFNNSGISIFTHILSFVLLIGFTHEQKMRSIYLTLANATLSLVLTPLKLGIQARKKFENISIIRSIIFWSKCLMLPLAISILFYILYANANFIFSDFFATYINLIYDIGNKFFSIVSIEKFIFLLFGALIITGTTAKYYFSYFLSKDLFYSDYVARNKMNSTLISNQSKPFAFNALRKELKAGTFLLLILNLLLLVLNSIDIKLLWFGFLPPDQFSMKKFVHEGTFFLIISILLSMIIVLYLFRKNQNFYSKNKTLKYLTYTWIAQNIILCISVSVRNSYYLFYDGLAYKRIWLFAFILVTVFGLVSLITKVIHKKSFYFLITLNSWSVYLTLVVLSFFNWDVIIAKTNINHWNGSGIDLDFYLQLSPETYPIISSNLDKIENQMQQHKLSDVRWVEHLEISSFKKELELKKSEFIKDQTHFSWASWNLSDQRAMKEITQKEKAIGLLNNY